MTRPHQVERLALAFLLNQLESEDIDVAFPERDTGIDFVAFSSRNRSSFSAVPVQLKASTKKGFYTNKKYIQIPELRIVYLWNIRNALQDVRAFCMPYSMAEQIVDDQNRSRKDGVYFAQASERLLEALIPFEVKSWQGALFGR